MRHMNFKVWCSLTMEPRDFELKKIIEMKKSIQKLIFSTSITDNTGIFPV